MRCILTFADYLFFFETSKINIFFLLYKTLINGKQHKRVLLLCDYDFSLYPVSLQAPVSLLPWIHWNLSQCQAGSCGTWPVTSIYVDWDSLITAVWTQPPSCPYLWTIISRLDPRNRPTCSLANKLSLFSFVLAFNLYKPPSVTSVLVFH